MTYILLEKIEQTSRHLRMESNIDMAHNNMHAHKILESK